MDTEKRTQTKTRAEQIAAACGTPQFYLEHKMHVDASSRLLEHNAMVAACIETLTARSNVSGHGLSHARKVAVDAGAIIMIERGISAGTNRLITLAHVAGILHDIKRSCKDHARQGAKEAGTILTGFDLTEKERAAVVNAIRNHEAFQPCTPLTDPDAQLLSDALYDADKFRWGPDNFTEMLWDISETRDIPVASLLSYFPSGLKSLKKIKGTFRTETGKRYGPGFIDLGLAIGETLYAELEKEYPPDHV
jgi:HD superfamily phosphohydrolase YqeK